MLLPESCSTIPNPGSPDFPDSEALHETPAALSSPLPAVDGGEQSISDHPTQDPRPETQDLVSDAHIREANRRLELLESFWAGVELQGLSRQAAARQVGTPYITLYRWEKRFKKDGFAGLYPVTDNSGRKSAWQHLVQDGPAGAEFAAKLRELYLATIGAGSANMTRARRTAKMATALICMADEPECPPVLAGELRRGRFPLCFQRFLRTITPELENRVRGAKHFQLNGLTSRRDNTLRFPDGSRVEMPAGFKWVFDDMSVNQPFFALLNGETLFSRQGLYAIDHRSLRWLGKMLVARPREAYRAEDILRFLRRLFSLYGKPDMIVFEQGVWRARKLRGFDVKGTVSELDRPEMAVTERENLSRGLGALGVKLHFATSAHGKIIETCFNHLQTVLAVKARQFVNIGRHAGEFELAAKRLRQVRAFQVAAAKRNEDGSLNPQSAIRNPQSLGFAPMHELSDCIDLAFAHINGRVNSRQEVPDQVWTDGITTRPLLPLAGNDLAAFLPEIRAKAIRGGMITVKVAGQQHDFRADWMVDLGDRYKVFVRFDPLEPTLGAAIYNRQGGSLNHQEFSPGQFIGWAAWEMPAPSADVLTARGVAPQPLVQFYGVAAVDQGDTLRKAQARRVATAFSALPKPGLPAVKAVEAHDGQGGAQKVERGTAFTAAPTRVTTPRRSAAPSEEEFERQSARLARDVERNRKLAAKLLT